MGPKARWKGGPKRHYRSSKQRDCTDSEDDWLDSQESSEKSHHTPEPDFAGTYTVFILFLFETYLKYSY